MMLSIIFIQLLKIYSCLFIRCNIVAWYCYVFMNCEIYCSEVSFFIFMF
jgi:hypothetical protein